MIKNPEHFVEHLKHKHGVLRTNVSGGRKRRCEIGKCKKEMLESSYLRHIEHHTVHFRCPFPLCPHTARGNCPQKRVAVLTHSVASIS